MGDSQEKFIKVDQSFVPQMIILCGMPASGKTTLGKALAEKLACPFIDSDAALEQKYADLYGEAIPCRMIYKQEGEAFFESLKKRVITDLLSSQDLIYQ